MSAPDRSVLASVLSCTDRAASIPSPRLSDEARTRAELVAAEEAVRRVRCEAVELDRLSRALVGTLRPEERGRALGYAEAARRILAALGGAR